MHIVPSFPAYPSTEPPGSPNPPPPKEPVPALESWQLPATQMSRRDLIALICKLGGEGELLR